MPTGTTILKSSIAQQFRWAAVVLVLVLLGSPALADKVKLSECPYPVQLTIQENLLGGKVEKIKEIRINDYVLYLVELDLKDFKEATLYIAGDGTLRKVLQEIKLRDLPDPVRRSIEMQVKRRGHIDDIEKEIVDGKVRYLVELERPKEKDQVVIFEADGTISFEK